VTSSGWLRLGAIVVVVAVIGYVGYLQSEVARLESEAAQRGVQRAAPSAPPRPAPSVAAGPRTLSAEQREAMVQRLGGRGQSAGTPVWFATVPNNDEAATFQRALQSAFEEAGWTVRGNAPVRFAMKPGVYLFAADEEPPEYVATAQSALEAAGITFVAVGSGYREFSRQKKEENSAWVGIDMGPDVTYVIVVGRKPEEQRTS
jgi:hypothetical protein